MTSPKPPSDRDLSSEIKLLKNAKQGPVHYNNETGLGGRFLLLYPLLVGLILLVIFILKR